MSTTRLVNVTRGSVRPRTARERRLRPARMAEDRMVAVMIERPDFGRPRIVRTRERERLQFLVARRLPPAVTVMPRCALRTANWPGRTTRRVLRFAEPSVALRATIRMIGRRVMPLTRTDSRGRRDVAAAFTGTQLPTTW